MTHPEAKPEELATPQQVEYLHGQIDTAMKYGGKFFAGYLSIYETFNEPPFDTVPAEIESLYPEAPNASVKPHRTVLVKQYCDPETGEPVDEGNVSRISFVQRDDDESGRLVTAQIFTMSKEGDDFTIERVITKDHIPARKSPTEYVSITESMKGAQERAEARREAVYLQYDLGLHQVTADEADRLIGFISRYVPEDESL